MSWQLINCKKAYELGPVAIANLRREERTLRAMGNRAGANVLASRIEVQQRQWDAFSALHEPAPLKQQASKRDLTKIDTQGL